MLAALIAFQSLVPLVSAAPTPKEDFVVNQHDFGIKHWQNEAFHTAKCLIAKEPWETCTDVLSDEEIVDALDFLAKHNSCAALTTPLKVKIDWGGEVFDYFPIKAYCYIRGNKCGKLTKANFPNYKKITLAKSICSGSPKTSKTAFAREEPVFPRLPLSRIDPPPPSTVVIIQNEDDSRTVGHIIYRGPGRFVRIRTTDGEIIEGKFDEKRRFLKVSKEE